MTVDSLNYDPSDLNDSNKVLNAMTDENVANQPFEIEDEMVFDSAVATMQMSLSRGQY